MHLRAHDLRAFHLRGIEPSGFERQTLAGYLDRVGPLQVTGGLRGIARFYQQSGETAQDRGRVARVGISVIEDLERATQISEGSTSVAALIDEGRKAVKSVRHTDGIGSELFLEGERTFQIRPCRTEIASLPEVVTNVIE